MPAITRRRFLRAAGVAVGLPAFDASRAYARPEDRPRRLLAVCNNLGLVPDQFFPTGTGRGYTPSPYLRTLDAFRDDLTVFSGVSHPEVDGGHPADNCFLTAAPHPASGGFRNTISLDQYIAERIGSRTRFGSLTLGVNTRPGVCSLSWTGSGVLIPCEDKPSAVFRRLFVQGTPAEVAAQLHQLRTGGSILDAVAGQARDLNRHLPTGDRARLDQYLTSVRELEDRLRQAQGWEAKPKPKPRGDAPTDPPTPAEYMDRVRLMYAMARLAFETDSTRCVTLMLDGLDAPALRLGDATTLTDGYHNLSHHGKAAGKLTQLHAIDQAHMRALARLFGDLKAVTEGGETLLDRTTVLYGSNLGNANTHVTTNLPVLLAGGGFKHAGHLAFDRERNYPLPNLFVSVLQRMGVEADRFASSTGTMRGLELA